MMDRKKPVKLLPGKIKLRIPKDNLLRKMEYKNDKKTDEYFEKLDKLIWKSLEVMNHFIISVLAFIETENQTSCVNYTISCGKNDYGYHINITLGGDGIEYADADFNDEQELKTEIAKFKSGFLKDFAEMPVASTTSRKGHKTYNNYRPNGVTLVKKLSPPKNKVSFFMQYFDTEYEQRNRYVVVKRMYEIGMYNKYAYGDNPEYKKFLLKMARKLCNNSAEYQEGDLSFILDLLYVSAEEKYNNMDMDSNPNTDKLLHYSDNYAFLYKIFFTITHYSKLRRYDIADMEPEELFFLKKGSISRNKYENLMEYSLYYDSDGINRKEELAKRIKSTSVNLDDVIHDQQLNVINHICICMSWEKINSFTILHNSNASTKRTPRVNSSK